MWQLVDSNRFRSERFCNWRIDTFLLFCAFVSMSLPGLALGFYQKEERLFELLDDGVLAVVVVSNRVAVIDAVAGVFSSEEDIERIESLVCDNTAGLMSAELFRRFMDAQTPLRDTLKAMDSISLIVHSFKDHDLEFSIVIDATDEQYIALNQELDSLSALLKEVKLINQDLDSVASIIGNMQRSRIDRFLVFYSGEGDPPISVTQRRPLLDLRAFRRAWKQIVATPWDVALYFAPRRSTELMNRYLETP